MVYIWQCYGPDRRVLDVYVRRICSALWVLTLADTVNVDTSASRVYGYTVLMGIGAGSFLASSFAVVQALVSPEEISNAVGFMSIGKLRRVRLLEYPKYADTT